MRADAHLKVTGQAQYTVDIDLPGMLHAKTLRSPHAHALITSIDTTLAEQAPGVRAVLSRDDLSEIAADSYGYFIKDQPIVATDRVRYIGDQVAAVAADTELQVVRALELIQVTYAPLPSASTMDEALAEGAPELFPNAPLGIAPSYGDGAYGELRPRPNVCYRFGYRTGSSDAFDRCDYVFTDEFDFAGRQQHVHLEPFASVARWVDGGQRLEVWSSCQNPFPVRKELGRLLGIGEHRIRMRVPYIGGGFGAKNGCKTEPIAALLARKAGAPVRYCLTNDENFLTQRQHNARLTLTTGVMADGTLIARKAEILLDGGAYADASPLVAEKAGYRVAGPYRWQHLDTVTDAVLTTTTPAGPFRGFGGTQANFACENQLDMIADRLDIDPVELRRKNLLQLGERYVPGESGMDSDIEAGLDLVADAIGWADPRPSGRGRGIAIGFKDSGGVNKPAQARVKVATSGDVFLQCGTVEIGQGIHTALRRVVADIVGVGPERVHWAELDTDHTPFDQGTNASSGISVMGQAVEQAARSVRSKILEFAAGTLSVPVHELDLVDGQIMIGGEARPLAPLVMATYGGTGYEFSGDGFFKATADHRAPLETQCVSWEYGWGAAEVAVDEQTGAVTVHRLVVSGDAGMALHADVCRGQDEGAAMMGLGGALFETMRYNGPHLANGNLVDYRIARANDVPAEFISILQEQGHGPGPFGSKGLGEGAMLPVASAIANAIFDATRGEDHHDAIHTRDGARRSRPPTTPGHHMTSQPESGIGITHLRHISLLTSALEESLDYYRGPWGLEVVDSGDGVAALRGTGTEHHNLRLTAADDNGLDHLGFALPSARAIDEGAQALADRGIVLTTEPGPLDGPGGGYGFEITDPEGRPIQFSTTVEAVVPRPLGPVPTKIAHVVLNTVDIDAAQAWWCDVLGFRVSDWSEHQMVFLRCNADHHSIAFNQAEKTSVNHVAYEVPSLDAFMTSLGRLNHAGHQPGWGPGRHGPGNNAFAYFVDPAGMVPEVTAEVQQIDEATWVPRVWRRVPELSDLWGTAGPPSEHIRSHMAG